MADITRDGWILADTMVRSYAAGFMGVRALRICEKVQCGVDSPQASLRVHRPINLGVDRRRELGPKSDSLESSCENVYTVGDLDCFRSAAQQLPSDL
jgi:hypothetical protein